MKTKNNLLKQILSSAAIVIALNIGTYQFPWAPVIEHYDYIGSYAEPGFLRSMASIFFCLIAIVPWVNSSDGFITRKNVHFFRVISASIFSYFCVALFDVIEATKYGLHAHPLKSMIAGDIILIITLINWAILVAFKKKWF